MTNLSKVNFPGIFFGLKKFTKHTFLTIKEIHQNILSNFSLTECFCISFSITFSLKYG